MRKHQIDTVTKSISAIQNNNNMTVNWDMVKRINKREPSNLCSRINDNNLLPHTYTQSLNNMCKYFQDISTYQYQQTAQQQQHTSHIKQHNMQHHLLSNYDQHAQHIHYEQVKTKIKTMNI